MSLKQCGQRLYYIPKPTRWTKGVGAQLPEEYKKFWKEWKLQEPTAVHYIKQEGTYARNEETGEVQPVQNTPIPLMYPKEFDQGIWGGEAVIQGFLKKGVTKRRVPHFWFPVLKRSVVYSEILDSHIRTVVTRRTINLIHENYGFDHYILKTPACDLKSELALKIKRQMLIALADKTLYPNDPDKREEVYNKYKEYLTAYTREEVEWYGLSFQEACKKFMRQQMLLKKVEPLKLQYRVELISKLQAQKENGGTTEALQDANTESEASGHSSWISRINPFSKRETK